MCCAWGYVANGTNIEAGAAAPDSTRTRTGGRRAASCFPEIVKSLRIFSERSVNSAQHLIGLGQDDTSTTKQDTTIKIEWREITELPGLQNGGGHVLWIVRNRSGFACRVTAEMVMRVALAKHNDSRGVGNVTHRVNVLDPTRRAICLGRWNSRKGNFPLHGGPVDAGPGVSKICPAVVNRV